MKSERLLFTLTALNFLLLVFLAIEIVFMSIFMRPGLRRP